MHVQWTTCAIVSFHDKLSAVLLPALFLDKKLSLSMTQMVKWITLPGRTGGVKQHFSVAVSHPREVNEQGSLWHFLLPNNFCKDHLNNQLRGKAGSCVDQGQQYRITLKIAIEGKADRKAIKWVTLTPFLIDRN